jgi:hypothetical protein
MEHLWYEILGGKRVLTRLSTKLPLVVSLGLLSSFDVAAPAWHRWMP